MITESPLDLSAFPVSWRDPEDATRTWMLDPIHFPRPLSPLFRTLWGPAFVDGINRAGREVLSPGFELRVAFQNGYYYESATVDEPAEGQGLTEQRTTEAALDRAIAGLMARWQEEWLPHLTATRDRLRTADPADGSPATLLALLDEVEAIGREDWLIHFRIVWPSMLAMQRFDELYADLFGDVSAADGHEMLVGQPGTSVLAGVALSDLAASARAAGLADLVTAAAPKDVPALLAASDAGRGLAEAIEDYLDRFGLQQDLFDYTLPTWQEDPAIVVGLLQGYLRSGVDARADHAAAVCRANGALGAARARLAGYPAAVRAEFEAAVAAARAASYLHLEHNVYIDQQGTSLTRRVLLKIGKRLVEAGALSRPEDVFVLSYDELRALASEPPVRHPLVAERWAELDRQRAMTAPPFLGPPPVEAPAASTIERAFLGYAGGASPAAEAPNELQGIPGSRGTAGGMARVVRTLEEAKGLQPGEILVAPTTLPTWTPLFATAAAIVTETGGPLSHSAVVARECGIPAVVGAAGATGIVRTGQPITVDGSRGVVVLA
jgi:pyruvate,water dikinase